LCSASKLKRGVIDGTGRLLWFSVIMDFSSQIFFVGFYLAWIVMRTMSVNHFQSNLILPYQLHWVTYFYEMWSEEFIYRAFNWSVKNTLMNRDKEPPPLFLVQKWKNGLWWMTFVMDNCLLDLFVVLDLDSEPIWIDNSCLFFICLSKVGVKYYLFNLIWQQYEKRHSVYMCRFLWKCPIQDMNVKCPKIQSTYFVNHDIYMYIGSIA
jgi:hypothetical protein